jgi:hypothetical protein
MKFTEHDQQEFLTSILASQSISKEAQDDWNNVLEHKQWSET